MVDFSLTTYKGFNIIMSGKDEFPYNVYYNDGVDASGTWVDVESSIERCKTNIDKGKYSTYVIKVKSLLKKGKTVPRYINNISEKWAWVNDRANKVYDEKGNVIKYIYQEKDISVVNYLNEMCHKIDEEDLGYMGYEIYCLGKAYSTMQSFYTDSQKKIYDNFVRTFNQNHDLSINHMSEDTIKEVLFKRHCLGKNTNKVSSINKVYYDFETPEEYINFIDGIKAKFNRPDIVINSFNRAKYIYDLFDITDLIEKNIHSILFTEKCHLYNEKNELEAIVILIPRENLTANFTDDLTATVVVMNSKREVAFVYPISFTKLLKITNEVSFI